MNWRRTRNYRHWRVKVIRRDGKCQICGSREKRQAHHIACGSYHPELRFDIENGVTLCYECHKNYHTNFNRSYRVKTTKYNFDNFKALMAYAMSLNNGKI